MRIADTARQLLSRYVNDGKMRDKVQPQVIYGAFAAIAFTMSVVNVCTMRIPLLIATASFCVLSLLNLLLTRFCGKKGMGIASNLFMAEVYALFMFFLITGGTDNFSVVWLLMLPSVGLLFFGTVKGTILCAVVWVSMALLFHVPQLMRFCPDYGNTFRLRFPIVYLSCYLVAWLLEAVRSATSKELESARKQYETLYKMDALTGTMNRYGMREFFDNARERGVSRMGVAILDIDYFKKINDRFGHSAGDAVLKGFSGFIMDNLRNSAMLFRFGGEEFTILDTDGDGFTQHMQNLRRSIREHDFTANDDDIRITVSMGVVVMRIPEGDDSLDSMIRCADEMVYKAKNAGRDRVEIGKAEIR